MAVFGDAYGDEDADRRMKIMKNYILECKEAKRRARNLNQSDKEKKKRLRDNTFLFILNNTKRLISDLEAEMLVEVKSLEEKVLIERSRDLAHLGMRIKNVETKITELLSHSSLDKENEFETGNIKLRYENLVNAKIDYISQVKEETREKELDKEDLFKEVKLNIRIPKFKGYGSPIDIYSFQSKFENMFTRSTPRRMMPDFLKNNFLEESPLYLPIDDIEEIWLRLKKAFGDDE